MDLPWRLIDTAPKDGTTFLAAFPTPSKLYSHLIDVSWWEGPYQDWSPTSGIRPTHWLPLPSNINLEHLLPLSNKPKEP